MSSRRLYGNLASAFGLINLILIAGYIIVTLAAVLYYAHEIENQRESIIQEYHCEPDDSKCRAAAEEDASCADWGYYGLAPLIVIFFALIPVTVLLSFFSFIFGIAGCFKDDGKVAAIIWTNVNGSYLGFVWKYLLNVIFVFANGA